MPSKYKLIIKTVACLLLTTLALEDAARAAASGVRQPAAVNAPLWDEREGAGAGPRVSPLEPERLAVPARDGVVREVHRGTNDKLIVHIQDAHANPGAQRHLAGVLDALLDEVGTDRVLVEGASGDVSLADLRGMAPARVWGRVAKTFLNRGQIAGEEYWQLTHDRAIRIEGIEAAGHYRAALVSYRRMLRHRNRTRLWMTRAQNAVERLKREHYPAELREYETGLREDANADGAGVGEAGRSESPAALTALVSLAGRTGQDLSDHPELKKLNVITASEKRLDWARVSAEQEALLAALRDRMPDGTHGELVERSRLRRTDLTAAIAWVDHLAALAERYQIRLDRYPNLEEYRRHTRQAAELNIFALESERTILEEKIYRQFLKSDLAQAVRQIDRYLEKSRLAHQTRLTSADHSVWTELRALVPPRGWQALVNRELLRLGASELLVPELRAWKSAQAAADAFYRSAAARDLVFTDRIDQKLSEPGSPPSAFVITGGYHTEHLTRLWRDRGYSYIVITPRVEAETDLVRYQKLLLASERDLVSGRGSASALRPAALRESPARLSAVLESAGIRVAGSVAAARLAAGLVVGGETGPDRVAAMREANVVRHVEGTVPVEEVMGRESAERVGRIVYPAAGSDWETVLALLDIFPNANDVYLVDSGYLDGDSTREAAVGGRTVRAHRVNKRYQDFHMPAGDPSHTTLVIDRQPGRNGELRKAAGFAEKLVELAGPDGWVLSSHVLSKNGRLDQIASLEVVVPDSGLPIRIGERVLEKWTLHRASAARLAGGLLEGFGSGDARRAVREIREADPEAFVEDEFGRSPFEIWVGTMGFAEATISPEADRVVERWNRRFESTGQAEGFWRWALMAASSDRVQVEPDGWPASAEAVRDWKRMMASVQWQVEDSVFLESAAAGRKAALLARIRKAASNISESRFDAPAAVRGLDLALGYARAAYAKTAQDDFLGVVLDDLFGVHQDLLKIRDSIAERFGQTPLDKKLRVQLIRDDAPNGGVIGTKALTGRSAVAVELPFEASAAGIYLSVKPVWGGWIRISLRDKEGREGAVYRLRPDQSATVHPDDIRAFDRKVIIDPELSGNLYLDLDPDGRTLSIEVHNWVGNRPISFVRPPQRTAARLAEREGADEVIRVEGVEWGDYNQEFFGQVTDGDREWVARVLAAEHGNFDKLKNLVEESGGRIHIKHRETLLHEEGRTVYLELEKPVEVRGRRIRFLRMKGVRPRMDDARAVRPYRRGDGVAAREEVLADGRIRVYQRGIHPRGGMLAEAAKWEYARSADKGPQADLPIAWGGYAGKSFGGHALGFVVLGIESSDVRLGWSRRASEHTLYTEDYRSGRHAPLDEASKNRLLHRIGAALRREHDSGYFHRAVHFGNIGLIAEFGEDGEPRPAAPDAQIRFRDLETTVRHPSTRDQEASLRYLDLMQALEIFHEAAALEEIRNFLDGYFGEDIDLAGLEAVTKASRSADLQRLYWGEHPIVYDQKVFAPEDLGPDSGRLWGAVRNLSRVRPGVFSEDGPNREVRNVVLISPEAAPFEKTGGLGEVVSGLAAAIRRAGGTAAVVIPRYAFERDGVTPKRTVVDREDIFRVTVRVNGEEVEAIVDEAAENGVSYYLFRVGDPARQGYTHHIYDESLWPDVPVKQSVFVSRASLAIIEKLVDLGKIPPPDVIHTHDWQTAPVHAIARIEHHSSADDPERDPSKPLSRARYVYSVHNLRYQGVFGSDLFHLLGLGGRHRLYFTDREGRLNFTQAALLHADAVHTVSPAYAEEIQQGGFGLDPIFRRLAGDGRLVGILNGVERGSGQRIQGFTPEEIDRGLKSRAKRLLRKKLGLAEPGTGEHDPPVSIMVSRLDPHQKGSHLLIENLERLILELGHQVAIVGSGDRALEERLRALQHDPRYEGRLTVRIGFAPRFDRPVRLSDPEAGSGSVDSADDRAYNDLVQLMFAGADIVIVPSLDEPMGITQIEGMHSGAIPVVRRTGGLKDTVTAETGFLFDAYTAEGLRGALDEADRVYRYDRPRWERMRAAAASSDFGWDRVLRQYADWYADRTLPDVIGREMGEHKKNYPTIEIVESIVTEEMRIFLIRLDKDGRSLYLLRATDLSGTRNIAGAELHASGEEGVLKAGSMNVASDLRGQGLMQKVLTSLLLNGRFVTGVDSDRYPFKPVEEMFKRMAQDPRLRTAYSGSPNREYRVRPAVTSGARLAWWDGWSRRDRDGADPGVVSELKVKRPLALIPDDRIKNILVRHSGLDDKKLGSTLVNLTPLLTGLRKWFPDARIWVSSKYAPILQRLPGLKVEQADFDRGSWRLSLESFSKENGIDLVIRISDQPNLIAPESTQYFEIDSIVPYHAVAHEPPLRSDRADDSIAAGARPAIMYSPPRDSSRGIAIQTRAVDTDGYGGDRNVWSRSVDFAAALGLNVDGWSQALRPVPVAVNALRGIRAKLAKWSGGRYPPEGVSAPVILINPYAHTQRHLLSNRDWAAAVRHLRSHIPDAWFVVLPPAQKYPADQFAVNPETVRALVGFDTPDRLIVAAGPLDETAHALMGLARSSGGGLVSVDTGLSHLAFLYGLTQAFIHPPMTLEWTPPGGSVYPVTIPGDAHPDEHPTLLKNGLKKFIAAVNKRSDQAVAPSVDLAAPYEAGARLANGGNKSRKAAKFFEFAVGQVPAAERSRYLKLFGVLQATVPFTMSAKYPLGLWLISTGIPPLVIMGLVVVNSFGAIVRAVILIGFHFGSSDRLPVGRALLANFVPHVGFLIAVPFQMLRNYSLRKIRRLQKINQKVEASIQKSSFGEPDRNELDRRSYQMAELILKYQTENADFVVHRHSEHLNIRSASLTEEKILVKIARKAPILFIDSKEARDRVAGLVDALWSGRFDGVESRVYYLDAEAFMAASGDALLNPSAFIRPHTTPSGAAGETGARLAWHEGGGEEPGRKARLRAAELAGDLIRAGIDMPLGMLNGERFGHTRKVLQAMRSSQTDWEALLTYIRKTAGYFGAGNIRGIEFHDGVSTDDVRRLTARSNGTAIDTVAYLDTAGVLIFEKNQARGQDPNDRPDIGIDAPGARLAEAESPLAAVYRVVMISACLGASLHVSTNVIRVWNAPWSMLGLIAGSFAAAILGNIFIAVFYHRYIGDMSEVMRSENSLRNSPLTDRRSASPTLLRAPVIEEIMMRGWMLTAIARGMGVPIGYYGSEPHLGWGWIGTDARVWAAVLMSATVFSVLHFNRRWVAGFIRGYFGVVLGAAYLTSGNLIVPIAVHALLNLVALIGHRVRATDDSGARLAESEIRDFSELRRGWPQRAKSTRRADAPKSSGIYGRPGLPIDQPFPVFASLGAMDGWDRMPADGFVYRSFSGFGREGSDSSPGMLRRREPSRAERLDQAIGRTIAQHASKTLVGRSASFLGLPTAGPEIGLVGIGRDEEGVVQNFLELGGIQVFDDGLKRGGDLVDFHKNHTSTRDNRSPNTSAIMAAARLAEGGRSLGWGSEFDPRLGEIKKLFDSGDLEAARGKVASLMKGPSGKKLKRAPIGQAEYFRALKKYEADIRRLIRPVPDVKNFRRHLAVLDPAARFYRLIYRRAWPGLTVVMARHRTANPEYVYVMTYSGNPKKGYRLAAYFMAEWVPSSFRPNWHLMGVVGSPVTFVKDQGYYERTIRALLIGKIIHEWQSNHFITLSPSAKRMYRRIRKRSADANYPLVVERKPTFSLFTGNTSYYAVSLKPTATEPRNGVQSYGARLAEDARERRVGAELMKRLHAIGSAEDLGGVAEWLRGEAGVEGADEFMTRVIAGQKVSIAGIDSGHSDQGRLKVSKLAINNALIRLCGRLGLDWEHINSVLEDIQIQRDPNHFKTTTIFNHLQGMHLRPSTSVSTLAQWLAENPELFESADTAQIYITANGNRYRAQSVYNLSTSAIESGTQLQIDVAGARNKKSAFIVGEAIRLLLNEDALLEGGNGLADFEHETLDALRRSGTPPDAARLAEVERIAGVVGQKLAAELRRGYKDEGAIYLAVSQIWSDTIRERARTEHTWEKLFSVHDDLKDPASVRLALAKTLTANHVKQSLMPWYGAKLREIFDAVSARLKQDIHNDRPSWRRHLNRTVGEFEKAGYDIRTMERHSGADSMGIWDRYVRAEFLRQLKQKEPRFIEAVRQAAARAYVVARHLTDDEVLAEWPSWPNRKTSQPRRPELADYESRIIGRGIPPASAARLAGLQQGAKVVGAHTGGLEDAAKRSAIDLGVVGYDQDGPVVGVEQLNVTAALAHHDKTGTLQSGDRLAAGDQRLGHFRRPGSGSGVFSWFLTLWERARDRVRSLPGYFEPLRAWFFPEKHIREASGRKPRYNRPTPVPEEPSVSSVLSSSSGKSNTRPVQRFEGARLADHLAEGREAVRQMGVGRGMVAVSVGPGAAPHRLEIDDQQPIPWERFLLDAGGDVKIFEPEPLMRLGWDTEADRRLTDELKHLWSGTLKVAPAERSRFQTSGLPDRSVDVIVMMSVLSDVTLADADKEAIIREAKRVLKPGGYLIAGWYNGDGLSTRERERTEKYLWELGLNTPILSGSEPQNVLLAHDWAVYRAAGARLAKEERVIEVRNDPSMTADRRFFNPFDNGRGLHGRPSAVVSTVAAYLRGNGVVTHMKVSGSDDAWLEIKSALDIVGLAIDHGERLGVKVSGDYRPEQLKGILDIYERLLQDRKTLEGSIRSLREDSIRNFSIQDMPQYRDQIDQVLSGGPGSQPATPGARLAEASGAIDIAAVTDAGDEDTARRPVKDHPIVPDRETIGRSSASDEALGELKWVGLGQEVFDFVKNVTLNMIGKTKKYLLRLLREVVRDHFPRTLRRTSRPDTRPDLREESSDAKNSGREDSQFSLKSSNAFLPNKTPSVLPLASTSRRMPSSGNGSLEGETTQVFSSARPLIKETMVNSSSGKYSTRPVRRAEGARLADGSGAVDIAAVAEELAKKLNELESVDALDGVAEWLKAEAGTAASADPVGFMERMIAETLFKHYGKKLKKSGFSMNNSLIRMAGHSGVDWDRVILVHDDIRIQADPNHYRTTILFTHQQGMHLRPSTRISSLTGNLLHDRRLFDSSDKSEIYSTAERPERKRYRTISILDLSTSGIESGTELTIDVVGAKSRDTAQIAAEAICDLLKDGELLEGGGSLDKIDKRVSQKIRRLTRAQGPQAAARLAEAERVITVQNDPSMSRSKRFFNPFDHGRGLHARPSAVVAAVARYLRGKGIISSINLYGSTEARSEIINPIDIIQLSVDHNDRLIVRVSGEREPWRLERILQIYEELLKDRETLERTIRSMEEGDIRNFSIDEMPDYRDQIDQALSDSEGSRSAVVPTAARLAELETLEFGGETYFREDSYYTSRSGAKIFVSERNNPFHRIWTGRRFHDLEGVLRDEYESHPKIGQMAIGGREVYLYGDIFRSEPKYKNDPARLKYFDFDRPYLAHGFSGDKRSLATIFKFGILPAETTGLIGGDTWHPDATSYWLRPPRSYNLSQISIVVDPDLGYQNYSQSGSFDSAFEGMNLNGIRGWQGGDYKFGGEYLVTPNGRTTHLNEVQGGFTPPDAFRCIIVPADLKESFLCTWRELLAQGYVFDLSIYDDAGILIHDPAGARMAERIYPDRFVIAADAEEIAGLHLAEAVPGNYWIGAAGVRSDYFGVAVPAGEAGRVAKWVERRGSAGISGQEGVRREFARFVRAAGPDAKPVRVTVDLSGVAAAGDSVVTGYVELLRDLQEQLELPIWGADKEKGLVVRDSGLRLEIWAPDLDLPAQIRSGIDRLNQKAADWAIEAKALDLSILPATAASTAGQPTLTYQTADAGEAEEIGLLNLGPFILQGAEALRWAASGRGLENHPILRILAGPDGGRKVAAADVEVMLGGRGDQAAALRTALRPAARLAVGEFLEFVAWARRQVAVMA